MAIKKRSRVLTPEEFKAKQKRDYAPFWINTPVIFGANLYPVSDTFAQQVTVIFLLDVADYTTDRVCELVNAWLDKYDKLQWEAVLTFEQKYAFLKQPSFYGRYKNQKIFLDTFGELFQRFGSGKEPVAVILKNGELMSSLPLVPDFLKACLQLENDFQRALRFDDQGLPLLKVEKPEKRAVPYEQQTIPPGSVTTYGEWSGSSTLLLTEKNNSALSTPFKGKHLRLIGMSHPNARDPIKVAITFNDKPLSSSIRSSIVHDDDETGATIFEMNKINGIYELFDTDHELSGIVKLTFLNAYDNGAVFYEFKIS